MAKNSSGCHSILIFKEATVNELASVGLFEAKRWTARNIVASPSKCGA
jgi:hypothetical protein